jgi:hypothetical protein
LPDDVSETGTPDILSYVLPLTTLAGVLCGELLLITGGLYPDRKCKRYSRTESGAVAAIVIYALWDMLTR